METLYSESRHRLTRATDATTKNLFPQIDRQFHGGINT